LGNLTTTSQLVKFLDLYHAEKDPLSRSKACSNKEQLQTGPEKPHSHKRSFKNWNYLLETNVSITSFKPPKWPPGTKRPSSIEEPAFISIMKP